MSELRLKVGDKVRVIKDPSDVSAPRELLGTVQTIQKVDHNDIETSYQIKKDGWWLNDRHLELFPPEDTIEKSRVIEVISKSFPLSAREILQEMGIKLAKKKLRVVIEIELEPGDEKEDPIDFVLETLIDGSMIKSTEVIES